MAYMIFVDAASRRNMEKAARSDGVASARAIRTRERLLDRFLPAKALRIGAGDLSRVPRRHDGLVEPSAVRAVVAESHEEFALLTEIRAKHEYFEWVQPPEALDVFFGERVARRLEGAGCTRD